MRFFRLFFCLLVNGQLCFLEDNRFGICRVQTRHVETPRRVLILFIVGQLRVSLARLVSH